MRKFKNSFNRNNPQGLFFQLTVFALFAMMTLLSAQTSAQQPAIIGATSASNRAVVFPDANVPGTQNLVPGLPTGAQPHGVAYFGSDNALVSSFSQSQVFVVQISTASLVSTINTATAGYDGTGTIVVAPNLTAALAMGSSNSLKVIQGPFGPASTISSLTMPGTIMGYQTEAIVFNNAGRAFVYHSTGISVLDAPYTSIAFTIPVAGNGSTGSIGISPDGNTLLTTTLAGNVVRIFQAPFSAASTSTNLTIPGGNGLDGIMVAPNGQSAIVVSAFSHHAAAIAAPFSSSSTVGTIPLPTGSNGFEDVGISADSQIAILAGNSTSEPAVFIQAPFGATSVTSNVPLMTGGITARGNGAVRFLPPGLAPGLTVSKSAPMTVASGANLTYTISYANTGTANAFDVVIRDPVPTGTTFVSATNGGTLMGNDVVFNIGTVNAGAGTQTVSFTVTVNTAAGGTVVNSGYTIEGEGTSQIPGPPVTTSVTAGGTPTPTPTPTPTATPTATPTPTPTPGVNVCTPTTTVTEGDLFPGGIVSFGVSSGPGSVTVDHVNAGTGLQSLTVVGAPVNAVVNIPAFTPGTTMPVVVTFTPIDPGLGVDFTLRAASEFHAANIRVRCPDTCTPTTTVTEGDLFPGGIVSFGITSGPGTVTVDHVNAGTGLQSLTVVGAPVNAVVNIPAFTPGTTDPVVVTFFVPDPSMPTDFTLRAASTFHAANIRARCITNGQLPRKPKIDLSAPPAPSKK